MQHLEEGTIHAWLDGALDATESARIERHVAECEVCSAAVAEARGMIAGASRIISALDVVPGNVIPRPSGKAAPRGWLWRSLHLSPGRAALAATLLLAVGTMLTVQHAPSGATGSTLDTSSKPTRPFFHVPTPPGPTLTATAAPAATPSAAVARASKPAHEAITGEARKNGAAGFENTLIGSRPPSTPASTPASVAPVTNAPPTTPITVAATPVPRNNAVTVAADRPARSMDTARLDSMNKTLAKTMAGGAPAAQGARAFAAARAVSPPLADAARSTAISGCYRVNSDSAISASFDVVLPQRFLLQQTSGPPPQNIVRAVSPDGRIDSVVAGTRWERLSPTMTKIYLNRSLAESTSILTMRFADGIIAGQLSTPAGTRNVDVSRLVCRP